MKFILDLVYSALGLAISPMVVYRMLRHNRYRSGWKNRFGNIVRKNPEKKCIWIHAVSVGEVNAAVTIVNKLKERFPDFEIVISTTTDTGYARASSLYAPELSVFYFPLDFSQVMSRAFRKIAPAICLLMELEVWPNFVSTAKELDIPVVVVNGRLSQRSFGRYQKVKPLIKTVFNKLTLILAQTQQYADRFVQLGLTNEKVIVTGSVKYDTAQITDKIKDADEIAAQLNIAGEKLWVAGGTGNDEEKIIVSVYKKLVAQENYRDLRLVIVPRKPERFDEVAELITQAGLGVIRYSQYKGTEQAVSGDGREVILGDTMGDLRKFYSLATIIFVGRSLVPMGGSDMMEAAALGKCTMFGSYAFNFKQTVDALLQADGAIMVRDENDLLVKMEKCLTETELANKIALKGRQVIIDNQGATQKTMDQIARILEQ